MTVDNPGISTAMSTDSNEMTDAQYRAWENRMRRRARKQGLSLLRSRSRTFTDTHYGRYMLVNQNNVIEAGDFSYGGMDLAQVEHALSDEEERA